ncbi:ATP-dependent Lon protease [Variovorax sp. HW608]|uniref:AAA family ATPase n=1 Tax=Variovorax sp. HW608 TaxID=1034889 RepID=UPI00081F89CB|nr:AAA family ATPase [Variovorax sp. HW608]SCK31936.1 ATP-dependent Lon protease [Variovorax sp. HW608]
MFSIQDDVPAGFRLSGIARPHPHRPFELLLPLALADELREKEQERARIAQAAREAEEDLRREEFRTRSSPPAAAPAAPVPNPIAFVTAFERGVLRRRRDRQHPVLRGEELLRVIGRIATLRDKDYQKRELELTKKLELAGALRGVANPAFRPQKWAKALEYLREAHPHFAEVTDFVARRVTLSTHGRQPLRIPPIHLWGDPGLGKTHYANDLARALGAPIRRHSFENAQTTSMLLGTERHWSTASQGMIFQEICLGRVANPVFLLDELDKAPRGSQYDPLAALHSLLEPVTACRARDASLDIEFDASLATYIATSNDPSRVPESLRSRFREFHIQPPTGADALLAARVVATAATQQLGIGGFAATCPAICKKLAHLTAREIYQAVQDAAARAVDAGRFHLLLADLPLDALDPDERGTTLH